MAKWLALLAFLIAAPVYAAEGDPASSETGDDEGVDSWQEFDVGGVQDGAYLPLSLGRDRTGLGLRARASFGWDSNIFLEDKDDDTGIYMDGAASTFVGANFGICSLGARAQLAGRLYFGDPDAGMWDLKLGGFFKVPYDGGFGFGISGDALYQQLHTYEITGPLTRQDDLRASGYIARAFVGYQVSFIIFELGFTGQTTDFSEEKEIPSLDSWTIGSDFGVYLKFWDFMELHPYIAFDYEWFRDQVDIQDDGTPLSTEDKLQLLKFTYGCDFKLDLSLIEAQGRVYSSRQDDSAAGHRRYWQYGVKGAVDLNFVEELRLTVGTHIWTREYDDLQDIDNTSATEKTVHERYLQGWLEASYNFWEFMSAGARYVYTRRASDIDNAGYADHDISLFLEIGW